MKLQIVSDLHLEQAPLASFELRGDVLVLPGDTHVTPQGVRTFLQSLPPDLPVVTVLGNHEFDFHYFPAMLPAYREAAAPFKNVYLLENQSVEIGGVTFMGATLWSDMWRGEHAAAVARVLGMFGMRGVAVDDLIDLHRHSVQWLEASFPRSKPAVVVTHMAPSHRSIHPKFAGSPLNGFFASDLEPLIKKLRPPLWVHGHMHTTFDYKIASTRVVCHPRGYPGENPLWNPLDKIIEI